MFFRSLKIIRKILKIGFFFLLTGCHRIPPGLNMETGHMVKAPLPPDLQIVPTLIPITPATITHQPDFHLGYHYLVGPQDIINIQIWNHPEFNVPSVLPPDTSRAGDLQQDLILQQSVSTGTYGYGYLVGPEGELFFPIVGNLPVSGLTVEQIRQRLTQKMTQYIRNPQVQIRVTSFRSQKVYVMGEVKKPGVLPITDVPLSITDAITMAGGVDQTTADPGRIYVIRGSLRTPLVFWLDAHSADALILGSNFHLYSHDIVFVSTADIVRWNRVISQILPTIETIWYTNSLMTNR